MVTDKNPFAVRGIRAGLVGVTDALDDTRARGLDAGAGRSAQVDGVVPRAVVYLRIFCGEVGVAEMLRDMDGVHRPGKDAPARTRQRRRGKGEPGLRFKR